ncbi:MAG: transposon-encoded TnpW family protein [Oscillospiraceae bacterium]|nr:transposon-encoded TnpW family protein [Oscillospiraceae bacterium]
MNEIDNSPRLQNHNPAGFFIKKIGNTTFYVDVHFSNQSTETAQDKIKRLIQSEFVVDKNEKK